MNNENRLNVILVLKKILGLLILVSTLLILLYAAFCNNSLVYQFLKGCIESHLGGASLFITLIQPIMMMFGIFAGIIGIRLFIKKKYK